jgi:hypothetical protein
MSTTSRSPFGFYGYVLLTVERDKRQHRPLHELAGIAAASLWQGWLGGGQLRATLRTERRRLDETISCLLYSFVLAPAFFVLPATAQTDPDANSLIRFSQSPEAEATFDLFENIYDIMLTPAPSAFIEQDGYFTQLGNVGGRDNFRCGFVREVGPGNLVVRVAGAMDEFRSSSVTDFTFDDTDDPFFFFNDRTTDELSVEFADNNLFASYAWPLGDSNQSLGFALVYDDQTFETESGFMNDVFSDAPPPPSTVSVTEDESFVAEFDTEAITLIGEWMRQGNIDIRIRGLLQDLEITERSIETEDVTVLDRVDDDTFTFFSSELSDRTRDGQCYGAEVDLRWDDNPNLRHRVDVGIKTADLGPKQNIVEELFSELVSEDLVSGDVETETTLFQSIAEDADITMDNWFAVWKTWWRWDNVHFAAGGSVFGNETEFSAKGELVARFTRVFEDGDRVPDVDDFVDLEQRARQGSGQACAATVPRYDPQAQRPLYW